MGNKVSCLSEILLKISDFQRWEINYWPTVAVYRNSSKRNRSFTKISGSLSHNQYWIKNRFCTWSELMTSCWSFQIEKCFGLPWYFNTPDSYHLSRYEASEKLETFLCFTELNSSGSRGSNNSVNSLPCTQSVTPSLGQSVARWAESFETLLQDQLGVAYFTVSSISPFCFLWFFTAHSSVFTIIYFPPPSKMACIWSCLELYALYQSEIVQLYLSSLVLLTLKQISFPLYWFARE